MSSRTESPKSRRTITIILALVILIPSLLGFGYKFLALVALYRSGADGAYAITPIVNYLLASLGFLCLFCWAALEGMLHDVERPSQTMLETERRLDAEEAQTGK